MSTFPAIRIEGGLLGPDTLSNSLRGELPGQKPADFWLDGRRSLLDEIAEPFSPTARKYWEVFQRRLERLPENDPATSRHPRRLDDPVLQPPGLRARATTRAPARWTG
jgi:hypothetical protein